MTSRSPPGTRRSGQTQSGTLFTHGAAGVVCCAECSRCSINVHRLSLQPRGIQGKPPAPCRVPDRAQFAGAPFPPPLPLTPAGPAPRPVVGTRWQPDPVLLGQSQQDTRLCQTGLCPSLCPGPRGEEVPVVKKSRLSHKPRPSSPAGAPPSGDPAFGAHTGGLLQRRGRSIQPAAVCL